MPKSAIFAIATCDFANDFGRQFAKTDYSDTLLGIESVDVCAGGVLVDVEKLARHRGRDVTRFANLLMKEKVGGAALRGRHHLRRERRPAPRLQEAQLVLRNSSPGRAGAFPICTNGELDKRAEVQ